ncbi:uncharacterized protein DFL_000350 [Arthrobotrys flagrans]|uniref:Uncharacterized protein n=1 Tax=Arthrobotrys flagrans TaxID=97331 RepID=A0A437AEW1_ARTFL|nr:hypothetical protein DFL_000350 [Arthrobotrys flagrans]
MTTVDSWSTHDRRAQDKNEYVSWKSYYSATGDKFTTIIGHLAPPDQLGPLEFASRSPRQLELDIDVSLFHPKTPRATTTSLVIKLIYLSIGIASNGHCLHAVFL